jgi:hypothetical protein
MSRDSDDGNAWVSIWSDGEAGREHDHGQDTGKGVDRTCWRALVERRMGGWGGWVGSGPIVADRSPATEVLDGVLRMEIVGLLAGTLGQGGRMREEVPLVDDGG